MYPTGSVEYFNDPCEDVFKWLNSYSEYSYFKEGWALYAETPLVSENTDTYHGHPLKEYGMLQWEVITCFVYFKNIRAYNLAQCILDLQKHYIGPSSLPFNVAFMPVAEFCSSPLKGGKWGGMGGWSAVQFCNLFDRMSLGKVKYVELIVLLSLFRYGGLYDW